MNIKTADCVTTRHHTSYVIAGNLEDPLIILIHGWPELSISWHKQIGHFAALGFCVVAPDMRGYGNSTVYDTYAAYAIEEAVTDMLELLDHLGKESAIWIGHDWGAPVVWSLASHHAEKCRGIAAMCVPYIPNGFAPENLIPLVNREIYPAGQYPAGQWDYMVYYQENFAEVQQAFEANVAGTFKVMMRSGIPEGAGKPSRTSTITSDGGWFGGTGIVPEVPADAALLPEELLQQYTSAFSKSGFFGANAWYMNGERNIAFASKAPGNGKISIPVLFIHASYDWICDTQTSRLAEPMRENCSDLTERIIDCGHWIAQEKGEELNAVLADWIGNKLAV